MRVYRYETVHALRVTKQSHRESAELAKKENIKQRRTTLHASVAMRASIRTKLQAPLALSALPCKTALTDSIGPSAQVMWMDIVNYAPVCLQMLISQAPEIPCGKTNALLNATRGMRR